jgi:hypothetical protein
MGFDLSSQKGYLKAIENIQQELERENAVPLKRISNELTEYCATNNDFQGLYLSVMAYILYKALNQNHLISSKTWKSDKDKLLYFFDSMKAVQRDQLKNQLNKFIDLFKGKNEEFYNYIKNIEKKGRVKVGARLYSMGFSTSKIQDVLQVNVFEMQRYLADSQTHNQKLPEYLMDKKIEMLLKESRNVIFDSSALISLGNTGLIDLFEEFKKRNPNVNLYITEAVHQETIDIQDRVVRYGWIGVQYEYLLQKGIFTLIKQADLPKNTSIEDLCNNSFFTKHGSLELLQKGELESIIFAKEKNAVLVIDEIVTRWLIESPMKLHELMETRYKEKVSIDKIKLNKASAVLKNVPVIRSVDFVAFAIRQGYFDKYKNLDYKKQLLYALKYAGCATTYEEIDKFISGSRRNSNVKKRIN